ncbi:hypothetical protein CRH09_26540 [Nocardia terpenica]|uniref:Uncharacterized protein n=1 Tax=Nocardia terpenica TaxID=455432 RepID=A0A291RPE7_9NOCA|nr:hypothetical protein CRH09_26540 [Nocardia terpenica]
MSVSVQHLQYGSQQLTIIASDRTHLCWHSCTGFLKLSDQAGKHPADSICGLLRYAVPLVTHNRDRVVSITDCSFFCKRIYIIVEANPFDSTVSRPDHCREHAYYRRKLDIANILVQVKKYALVYSTRAMRHVFGEFHPSIKGVCSRLDRIGVQPIGMGIAKQYPPVV